MNFMLLWVNEQGQRELVTPPLDGTILPGVTRQSILDLCRQWGEFAVVERRIPMAAVLKAASEGRILEAFGAGTAAVVSPVKLIHFNGVDITVPLDPSDPNAGAGACAGSSVCRHSRLAGGARPGAGARAAPPTMRAAHE